ncbi:MAP/microtubule affinity-regulating kinase 3 [Phlyctochytrium bullatum]|nr:MAP/microtubule affinity-regulating kinase 3 [Phlyctochytrium bullatum]
MIEKKVLGSYHVGKTIGQGAFSKVKLGVHKETGQKVAIKIIDKKQMALKAAKAKKANEERERRKREQQQKAAGAASPSAAEAGGEGKKSTPSGSKAEDPAAAGSPTSPTAPAKEGEAKPDKDPSVPAFVSALQLEVQLLMRLDHPNVITLYQVMETEDECYVVMEFASGGELIEYIAARNHLSEKEARRFFRQLISAMDHCHMANVVHRDLKLENLLLTDNKTLLISDFGLGRTFQNDTDELMKTFCGTPNYAAVELISGIPYIGVKSDIWAMGVVLYVMMTGKPPFTGENISALYSKIKAVDYTCPDYFSPELRSLFSKILKKDPKQRIDMDGLRMDPWVNMDENEPPLRIFPKIMGPPTAAQVGQCIASITRDSECIIYTIRSHMRDGKSISGAEKMKSPRRASAAALTGTPGGRRRSSSFAPAPNAQDLRPLVQNQSRSVSPQPRAASIREDGEDEVGELPARTPHNQSGSLPRPSTSRGGNGPRRMSLMESSKGSPMVDPSGRPFVPHSASLPRGQGVPPGSPFQTPSMAPDQAVGQEMGRSASVASSMPSKKRRNTITMLFGGKDNNSADGPLGLGLFASHNRAATEEPRSPLSPSGSISDSSTGALSVGRSSVGPAGNPRETILHSPDVTMPERGRGAVGPGAGAGRTRRATLSSNEDRTINLMRRMSMVSGPPISPDGSMADPLASGTMVNESMGSTLHDKSTPQGDLIPSKQEIEEWHLMHRPAREIRSVRYNFSSKTTSTLNPAAIFQEVHRVLLLLQRQFDNRISFQRTDDFYQLTCKLSEPNPENNVEFEIEVCKIWLLKVHGVRIKRLSGSAFVFKDIYASIVDELNI